MATIKSIKKTRLYDFTSGTSAKSQQVDDEFNQLIASQQDAVDDINAITSSEGAQLIGVGAISDIAGNDVQSVLEELKAQVDTKPNSTDVYTKLEIEPYIRGGDTLIKVEVFTIINSNIGDGTFSYSDKNNVIHIGALTAEGYQTFMLQEGSFPTNENRVSAVVNDTLNRSTASGGLIELTGSQVALTMPEGAGAEITVTYYERLGIVGAGFVQVSDTQIGGGGFWFKVVG